MRNPTPKFAIGDIIQNKKYPNSPWRRRIVDVQLEMRGYGLNTKPTVCYLYENDKLDNKLQATGDFDPCHKGYCSEAHLCAWGFKVWVN